MDSVPNNVFEIRGRGDFGRWLREKVVNGALGVLLLVGAALAFGAIAYAVGWLGSLEGIAAVAAIVGTFAVVGLLNELLDIS